MIHFCKFISWFRRWSLIYNQIGGQDLHFEIGKMKSVMFVVCRHTGRLHALCDDVDGLSQHEVEIKLLDLHVDLASVV
ncbi:hypothetical protein SCA6_000973 [Theobroma cacao]